MARCHELKWKDELVMDEDLIEVFEVLAKVVEGVLTLELLAERTGEEEFLALRTGNVKGILGGRGRGMLILCEGLTLAEWKFGGGERRKSIRI
jgi:hypothetical protein